MKGLNLNLYVFTKIIEHLNNKSSQLSAVGFQRSVLNMVHGNMPLSSVRAADS